ncbi:MAG: hypothetical protein AAF911_09530 [Planctomycetota bacterium]
MAIPTGSESPGVADAAPQLHGLLQRAAHRWRSARRWRVLVGGLAVLLFALLVGVLIDAVWGLPAWGLWAIDLGLLAILLGGLTKWWRAARNKNHDPRRTAVALERRSGVASSRLINALDLSRRGADEAKRSSPALTRLAVEHGDAAAAQVDAGVLIDRVAQRRAWLSLLAAVTLLSGAWLTMPGVFGAVVPRLMNPSAGLPAYTTLRFDVAIIAGADDESIRVGKPAVVEVTLSRTWGRKALPSEADVVVIDADGTQQPLPMHRSFREGDLVLPPMGTAHATALPADAPAPPTRFSLRFERIDQPLTFYIDTPAGRSGTYTITPDTTPLFESLHVTVTPPDYTGWAATTQRLQVDEAGALENRVRALHGSAITLTAASNVPLAEARLRFDDASQPQSFAAATADRDTTAEAFFIAIESGDAALQLVGVDGKASPWLPVALETLDDAPPTVNIHSPEPLALAVEGYPVPIRVVAKDDVGLASLALHLSEADQDLAPIELGPVGSSTTTAPPFEPRLGATHELDLAALGAKPGDTVRYFAAAHDALPFALGGPPHDAGQRAESTVYEIQIISQEEWEELARLEYGLEQLRAEAEAFRAQMDELAEDRAAIVEQLAALKEKIEAGEALNDLERQQLQDLQQQLDAFADASRALAEAMRQRAEQPSLYEFEEPFKEQLRELADQLERQADLAEAMEEAAVPLAEAQPSEAEEGASGQNEASPEEQEQNPSGFPGVTPTQVEEFLDQAQQLTEDGEPFDETTRNELDELEEDLLRLELAEEMLHHAERIRTVIVEQRELEKRLATLRFRPPDELTDEERERLESWGEQAWELRDELEDAALMLRESAELAGPLLPNMSGSAVMLTEKLDRLEVYPDMERVAERAEQADAGLAHAAGQLAADKLETLLSDAGGMPNQAQQDFGFDPPLNLPKAGLSSAMQQMSSARAGEALRQQLQNGQQPGQSPGGQSGSAARGTNATLIGPRPLTGQPRNAGSGREATGENDDPANPAAGFTPDVGPAENLNPDSTDSRTRPAISMPGVPARYRDVAAAYFQRLADEAARQDDP